MTNATKASDARRTREFFELLEQFQQIEIRDVDNPVLRLLAILLSPLLLARISLVSASRQQFDLAAFHTACNGRELSQSIAGFLINFLVQSF